ncbi:hypothetical protein JTB14_025640 [Gonioctena quinquepunctata]|nr:hypothetical protein JTB14_025640 [Gonioctena quinquepunctata]
MDESVKKRFYDPDSSELEVTPRNSVEDFKESKFSPNHLWENTTFNGELAKPGVDHIHKGVILKYTEIDEAAGETSTQNELGGRGKGLEASSYPPQSANSTTECPSGYPPNKILVVGHECAKKKSGRSQILLGKSKYKVTPSPKQNYFS